MDWMHNFLVHGVVNAEMQIFLQRCKEQVGVFYEDLQMFICSDWRWPSGQSTHKATDVFTRAREKSSTDHVKTSASELLMVFPLVREFALTLVRPTGKLALEVNSMVSLCKVLDCMLAAKRGQGADALRAVQAFLVAHRSAYGDEFLKPKHHYCFHNALQLVDRRLVADCFVHERKHQVMKSAASAIKNTSSFEASALGRVILEQSRQLRSFGTRRGLVGKTADGPSVAAALGLEAVKLSKKARDEHIELTAGDVIRFAGGAGIVRCCAQAEDRLIVVIESLSLVSEGDSKSTWRPEGEMQAIDLDRSAWQPYCWHGHADGCVTMLH